MDAVVSRLQTACKRADEARAQEISVLNPLPPFEEITHPWPLYWKFYRKGDAWSQLKGMPAWKSRPTTNIAFQVVETNTTLLTDSRPTAVPYSESGHQDDYYLAEWLKNAYLKWWNDQAGDIKTTIGVKYSRVFGLGWFRLDYEKDGQVWETIHPDQIRVSPDTTIDSLMVKEPTYLVYEYETQVGELRKSFPRKGYKKKLDWDSFNPEWDISMDYERLRPVDDESRFQPTKMVKVYQMWEKDPADVEWKDPIGDMEVTKSKPKYPGGKVTTVAGGIVLDVRANPYKHKQYPFIPVWAYIAPGQFYPIGDVQNIWSLSIMRNRMNQLLFDGTVKAGGGKILVGKGAGQPEFTNAPFEVVNVPGDVGQIRFESPSSPSRHLFDYIATIDRDIDNTAGIHDISKGARTPGNPVTAQEAAMLGESDRTRIRLAARLLTWSLNRLAYQWCYNVAQFDGETEWVSKVNQNPEEERLEGTQNLPVAYQFKDIMVDGKIEEGLRYGIKFTEFSSLPQALNEDKQLALQLFSGGALKAAAEAGLAEELLLALDWPNARAVAQKAMGAMQPPPPPEPPMGAPMPQAPMPPPQPVAAPQPVQEPMPMQPPMQEEMMMAVEELMAQGMPQEEAVAAVMAAAEGMM